MRNTNYSVAIDNGGAAGTGNPLVSTVFERRLDGFKIKFYSLASALTDVGYASIQIFGGRKQRDDHEGC